MERFYSDQQKAIQDTVRRFTEREVLPRAAAIDREDQFDRKMYRRMAELGLYGICLSESAGGAGLDTIAACIAIEELARGSGAVANAFAIPVEAVLFLDQHGSAAQKSLIPAILDGSLIPATAVSEPDGRPA
jgi:butyryl-CoA dehydrogenase